MLFPLIGLCIGAVIGLLFPQHIPAAYSQYVAVAILASMDSVIGGINAKLKGTYKENIFISGFFTNAIMAALLTYIGKRLDLDLYLAAIVVFGTRLFQNIAEIRRYLLKNKKKKGKIETIDNNMQDFIEISAKIDNKTSTGPENEPKNTIQDEEKQIKKEQLEFKNDSSE